jgi:hypothetical protein
LLSWRADTEKGNGTPSNNLCSMTNRRRACNASSRGRGGRFPGRSLGLAAGRPEEGEIAVLAGAAERATALARQPATFIATCHSIGPCIANARDQPPGRRSRVAGLAVPHAGEFAVRSATRPSASPRSSPKASGRRGAKPANEEDCGDPARNFAAKTLTLARSQNPGGKLAEAVLGRPLRAVLHRLGQQSTKAAPPA